MIAVEESVILHLLINHGIIELRQKGVLCYKRVVMQTNIQSKLSHAKDQFLEFVSHPKVKDQCVQSLFYLPAGLAACMAIAVLFIPSLVPMLSALLCVCVAVFLSWMAYTAQKMRKKLQQLMKSVEGKVIVNSLSIRDKVQKDKPSAPEGKKILYH